MSYRNVRKVSSISSVEHGLHDDVCIGADLCRFLRLMLDTVSTLLRCYLK